MADVLIQEYKRKQNDKHNQYRVGDDLRDTYDFSEVGETEIPARKKAVRKGAYLDRETSKTETKTEEPTKMVQPSNMKKASEEGRKLMEQFKRNQNQK